MELAGPANPKVVAYVRRKMPAIWEKHADTPIKNVDMVYPTLI